MSFTFTWPRFSDQFHADAIEMLDAALNKGNKPPVIADRIEVVELEMGNQPPELEIRDIGDLTTNQFRGIFRLTYAGDAYIVLKTKVQANPLYHKKPDIHLMGGSRGMLAANQPLVVPMHLRLSNFKLNSYVVLVVSMQKGITLVFKTDPLQNVDISSTFDSIAIIQKFIQTEIEGQLRQMFREDLPGIIHRLSQQWVKATSVEAPYLERSQFSQRHNTDPDISRHVQPSMTAPQDSLQHLRQQPSFTQASSPRTQLSSPRSVNGASHQSASRMEPRLPPTSPSVADMAYPVDHGHGAESMTDSGSYSGLGRLFKTSKGLADLTEGVSDIDDVDEAGYFDVGKWKETIPKNPLSSPVSDRDDVTEYETIPAVGGGCITRPRVYHSPSLLHGASGLSTPLNADSFHMMRATLQRQSQSLYDVHQPSLDQRRPYSALPSPRLSGRPRMSPQELYDSSPATQSGDQSYPLFIPRRGNTTGQLHSVPSQASHQPNATGTSQTMTSRSSSGTISTPKSFPPPVDAGLKYSNERSLRRASMSSGFMSDMQSSSSNQYLNLESDTEIVLRPGLNNAISQLSLLNYSNHTLSPYTRTLEHFTVRSVPPKPLGPSGTTITTDRQPVKARRKRIYRMGGQPHRLEEVKAVPQPALSPGPPSEFDVSDIDRYFRTHDDLLPHLSDVYPRQRHSYQTL